MTVDARAIMEDVLDAMALVTHWPMNEDVTEDVYWPMDDAVNGDVYRSVASALYAEVDE
jgi:hypothetical protein